jgi:hypothetical protein
MTTMICCLEMCLRRPSAKVRIQDRKQSMTSSRRVRDNLVIDSLFDNFFLLTMIKAKDDAILLLDVTLPHSLDSRGGRC